MGIVRSPPRLRSTLLFAASGHVLLALSLRAAPTRSAIETAATAAREVTVDVEPRVVERSATPVDEGPRPATATATATSLTRRAAEERPTVSSLAPIGPQIAPNDGQAPMTDATWSFDPMRRTASEIGIGSHWKNVVVAGAASEGSGPPAPDASGNARAAARAIDRSMRADLAARDVELGLGRAGPLVSATHHAASQASAPEVGTTTLEVECDATGTVLSARAEDTTWNDVATAVVRAMTGKPLRVPRGARGLRARLRIVVERALPSGSHGSRSLGAVPDDVAGGGSACDGKGLTRRCVNGMPVGVTSSEHDVSNVGAKPQRIVHVQLLSESEL